MIDAALIDVHTPRRRDTLNRVQRFIAGQFPLADTDDVMVSTVDKLLAGRPELRKHFVDRAADPGVSGDMLLAELIAAGVPVKRTAVYLWMRRIRPAGRARLDGLAARVVQAVLKLGRERLIQLATDLGVPTEARKRQNP